MREASAVPAFERDVARAAFEESRRPSPSPHAPDPVPATLLCRICDRALIECDGYGGHLRHGQRCGAWMPKAKEPCARLAGHRDSHRSRYALDNQVRAHRAA